MLWTHGFLCSECTAVIAFLVTAVILARNPKHPTSKFKQFIDLAQIMEVTVKCLPTAESPLINAQVISSVLRLFNAIVTLVGTGVSSSITGWDT